MDPAAVVVQAVVAGAGAGLQDTASAAVADGYATLKHLLVRRLTGRHRALEQLAQLEKLEQFETLHPADAGPHRVAAPTDSAGDAGPAAAILRELTAEFAKELATPGLVDPALLDQARRLLELAGPRGAGAGRYRVELHEARGVQVGDGNVQHNTFQ